ncbi:hypothetical protein ACFQ0B_79140 [Nonomuraea thailandensis]
MTAAAAKVTAIRGAGATLADAADEFLATHRVANPNTHRAYASAVDRTIAALGGRDRLLADVADAEIGDALTLLWGGCAPATWNRNRAAVSSWLTWCQAKKNWVAPSVPAAAERRRENVDHTKAVSKTTIERLLSRRDLPSGRRRSTGCCTRPPPAPPRSSPSTSRTWTWRTGAHRCAQGRRRRMGVLGRRHRPPPAPPAPAPRRSRRRSPRRARPHPRAAVPRRAQARPRPPARP